MRFLLFCMICFGQAGAQPLPVDNLVFEGAGIRGIAYSGALEVFEEAGLLQQVKRVGGTSAGAVTALAVALGYSSGELARLVQQTPYHRFNDGGFPLVGGLTRLQRHFGWYKGRRFEEWLGALIRAKAGTADLTFRQLVDRGFRHLYVTGTSLTRQRLLVFSHETYPDMRVLDAVRISMSIPLYFEPLFMDAAGRIVRHPKKKEGLEVLVDGGFTGNFPIHLFDSARYHPGTPGAPANAHTVGFRIDTEEQIMQDSIHPTLVPAPVTDLRSYIGAFYTIVLENLNRQSLTAADWERTVSISDARIGPRVRRLSATEVALLRSKGREAAAAFLRQRQR
jgi:NTE family protein